MTGMISNMFKNLKSIIHEIRFIPLIYLPDNAWGWVNIIPFFNQSKFLNNILTNTQQKVI